MDERERLVATGFALGTLVGGAIVAVMGSDQRNAVGRHVRGKLEEWTTGKSPAEVIETIDDGVTRVSEAVTRGGNRLPRGRE
jgi:hypothetical protein